MPSEEPYSIIARNICRLRSARKLTQERLCELAGIDRAYYQRVEARQKNMTIDYLNRVRKALKCKWADLFKGLE